MRSLYARANLLLRKFRTTQVQTKITLFNTFCSPIFMAVSCGVFFVKNRLTVYVSLKITLFVCSWVFLLGAVQVNYLLNIMLFLFMRWFVNNSILFCVHLLTVKIWSLKVLLNLTDFFSPRSCLCGELTYIYIMSS